MKYNYLIKFENPFFGEVVAINGSENYIQAQ